MRLVCSITSDKAAPQSSRPVAEVSPGYLACGKGLSSGSESRRPDFQKR